MTDWLVTAGGGVVVLAVLVDIFHTLANPGRQGRLSRLVHTAAWRLTRRSAWSGPLAMLAVIGMWGISAVLGWALVYWPHMPEGFSFPAGSSAAEDPAFLDALYVSLVTISTLGFGDVFPATGWLRVANPLEAIFGFALLTVAVSWVLQVYPALSRRRALALRLSILERAGTREVLPDLEPAVASTLLHGLAADIVGARIDLGDYAETYYFRENRRETALPATLGVAHELGTVATQSSHPDIQLAGRVLLISVADLLAVVEARFLRNPQASPNLMDAYLVDHRHHEG
ncbi:potassium channel family protein [Aeromicrobium sp.]|uniref:potassium channel family protein n=1 Tax=Aeromicrobium sp. TaxID=1871063 RepID=UPI002FCC48B9